MQHTKYSQWYDNLINTAKQRPTHEGYFESHHITPRSLGGDNSSTNLVALTAREHYLAHALLFKHYTKLQNTDSAYKMALAVQLMHDGFVSKLSDFKLKAGKAIAYAKAKEAISVKMTGSGNPMYGKTSHAKGKTWSELYSPKSIERMHQAAKEQRKHINVFTWVNGDKEEILSIHDLAEKYSISFRHLIDITAPTTDRRVCKGWSIKGTDTRNKYIREQCSILYTFYNRSNPYPVSATIDDMLASYPELKYQGLRNIVNRYSSGKYTIKSYKGWMMKEHYNK